MMLVSVQPGEHCRVRVYACASGSKLRTRRADVKFNHTPDRTDVLDLQRNPERFLALVTQNEVA